MLATNDIKDPVEALEIYRMKDTVEKHFDDLKNDLDMKRLRIHSAANFPPTTMPWVSGRFFPCLHSFGSYGTWE